MFIYLIIIAISVISSTIINVFIMKKIVEMATEEIDKVEKRIYKCIKINLK